MIETKKSNTHNSDDCINAKCKNCNAEYKDTIGNLKSNNLKTLPEEDTGIPDYFISRVCKNNACKEVFYFDVRTQSEKNKEKEERILSKNKFNNFLRTTFAFIAGIIVSFLYFNLK
jgi:hypothetical protein